MDEGVDISKKFLLALELIFKKVLKLVFLIILPGALINNSPFYLVINFKIFRDKLHTSDTHIALISHFVKDGGVKSIDKSHSIILRFPSMVNELHVLFVSLSIGLLHLFFEKFVAQIPDKGTDTFLLKFDPELVVMVRDAKPIPNPEVAFVMKRVNGAVARMVI
jgi:hypothetical protein